MPVLDILFPNGQILAVSTGPFFIGKSDKITADYSGADFDVYTYTKDGDVVGVTTVQWTSSAKTVLDFVTYT